MIFIKSESNKKTHFFNFLKYKKNII